MAVLRELEHVYRDWTGAEGRCHVKFYDRVWLTWSLTQLRRPVISLAEWP